MIYIVSYSVADQGSVDPDPNLGKKKIGLGSDLQEESYPELSVFFLEIKSEKLEFRRNLNLDVLDTLYLFTLFPHIKPFQFAHGGYKYKYSIFF